MSIKMKSEDILLLKSYAQKYTELKQKTKEMEDTISQIKDRIEDILIKNNINSVQTSTMCIKRNIIKQQRISKEDLPVELFDKYSHPISFSTLHVQINKK